MITSAARRSLLVLGPALAVGLISACSSSSSSDTASPTASATASASATSATATPSVSASATPSGTPVPTAELAALVADRTFTGSFEGTTYVEYYAPDGAIRGEQDGQKYTASWEVVGDTLCFTYPEDGADAGPDCYTATQDGDNVYWFTTDGNFSDATTFVTGNPQNL